MSKVITAADKLKSEVLPKLKNKKISVLANSAAVDSSLKHIVDITFEETGNSFVKIFAPEHGFRAVAQDMVTVDSSKDARTGIEIKSLYGDTVESLYPTKDDLQDIDILIVDLPDIGSRYYTYAESMHFCMSIAAQTDTKVIVLDRPNPINGIDVEGAHLVQACKSFCGPGPIANRHGMTLGELALLFNKGFSLDGEEIEASNCELDVVKCSNWSRDDYFDATGLPWVIPSPNMPTLNTAIVYPGACLFEATNLSEGRGTTTPFEFIGAEFIDGYEWSEQVFKEGIELDGVALRPIQFMPKFHKWAEKVCGGVQIHITDRKTFKPFRTSLALISSCARLYPEDFSWRTDTYEFIDNVPAIDLLYGTDSFRKAVECRDTLESISKDCDSFESKFIAAREDFLLY